MPRFHRLLVLASCAAASIVLAAPLALYGAGLSGVEGRPQKPLRLASAAQQELVWRRARGEGAPRIETMNPYSLALRLLAAPEARTPPGELLTWWVASSYLLEHKRYKGMGWWHLSGAALAIWLSPNWTSEEILTAAFLSLEQHAEDAVGPASAPAPD